MTQVTYIRTSVWINLNNGKEVQIFRNTENLDLPECYDFLEDLKISTSTDICAFICAWDPEEPSDFSEFDSRILPLFFRFSHNEVTFDEMLEKLNSINDEIGSDYDEIGKIIEKMKLLSADNYDNAESITEDAMNIFTEIYGKPPFLSNFTNEVMVPDPPIPASEIKSIFLRCRNVGYMNEEDNYDWEDYAEEFAEDSETPVDSPHYQYLRSKWTVFKFDNHPSLVFEGNPVKGLLEIEEYPDVMSVEEALDSGDIHDLIPENWWEKHEKTYYINDPDMHDLHESDTFDPAYKCTMGVEDSFSSWEHDTYKIYKNLRRKFSDPEKFETEVEDADWNYFGIFWHIGILHDSIEFASAEITAILLNSGYLDLTDEDLEYLIDYAIGCGKPEHTACLLNYKNERNR